MKRLMVIAAVLLLCSVSGRVHASDIHQALKSVATAAPATESAKVGMVQVDGILDSVRDSLWTVADYYFDHGDYPRVIDIDRIIVQADPHFVEVYSTGGWLMEGLGRKDDAEAFYQEGVRNNKRVADINYSLGMFYYNTIRDYSAAEAAYRADVKNCTDASLNDWKMLAHTLEREGKLNEAVNTWLIAQRRWPDGNAIQSNLSRILAKQRAANAVPQPTRGLE